jgi:hypothetical protein
VPSLFGKDHIKVFLCLDNKDWNKFLLSVGRRILYGRRLRMGRTGRQMDLNSKVCLVIPDSAVATASGPQPNGPTLKSTNRPTFDDS